ncbi:MAG: DUF192 domain-containing protein [Pseudomonadota bacterium]
MMRFSKNLTQALLFAVVFMVAACTGTESSSFAGAPSGDTSKVNIASGDATHSFKVEIAATREEQALGLMWRESLADDAGMLFDYSDAPQEVGIWMKNTLIPLDIAFIDEDGVIVRVEENAIPKSLTSMRSGQPVAAVLEVRGGRLAELGIDVGDKVSHPIFETGSD